MGKHLKMLLLLGIFVFCIVGCNESPFGNKTYVSKDGAICFQYPEDWEITDMMFYGLKTSTEKIFCPSNRNSRTNISLIVEKHEGLAPSAREQMEFTKKGMEELGGSHGIDDYKVIDFHEIIRQGRKAGVLTATEVVTETGITVKLKQAFFPNGRNTYILTLGTSPEQWADYEPAFDTMVDTFRFK